ncbi:MAG: hypothetical protein QMB98_02890, partial [Flaviflexus sp.]
SWAAADSKTNYTPNYEEPSNYRTGETTAAVKILVDRNTDLVIGAHMLGPEYSELVNVLALAMKLGLTTQQLKTATAAYPSVGTDLSSML